VGYRAFCDVCEKETERNFAREHAIVSSGRWRVEVSVTEHIIKEERGSIVASVLCEACLFQLLCGEWGSKHTGVSIFPITKPLTEEGVERLVGMARNYIKDYQGTPLGEHEGYLLGLLGAVRILVLEGSI